MRGNPGGKILHVHCAHTGKKTREGCDRGSEIGSVHNGRDGEGPVPLQKPKESGRRDL